MSKVRLDHLLSVYRVGSGDWPWDEEYDNLIEQADTQKLLARIRVEGIREPILLGTDGRIWDGHHRIVIAMHLGLDSVPIEFAGEEGALAAHDAEKRAEWEAEQDTLPQCGYCGNNLRGAPGCPTHGAKQGETEWEYIAQFGHVQGEERITAEAAIQSAREVLDDYPLDFPESELPLQVLRRPLVGWLPVPGTTNNESEGKA